jgi:hypothetical protein
MKTKCSLFLVYVIFSATIMNSLRIHNHIVPTQLIQVKNLGKASRCRNTSNQPNEPTPVQPVEPVQPVQPVAQQCVSIPNVGFPLSSQGIPDTNYNFYIKFLDIVIPSTMRVNTFSGYFANPTQIQILIYKNVNGKWTATARSQLFDVTVTRQPSTYTINPPLLANQGEIVGLYQKGPGSLVFVNGDSNTRGIEFSNINGSENERQGAANRKYSLQIGGTSA